MPTKQETFDFVATKLLEQGCQSAHSDGRGCLYRGPNNTKCAAGHLIDDADYLPEWDDYEEPFGGLTVTADGPVRDYIIAKGYDVDLVADLQGAHDGAVFSAFRSDVTNRLRRVAAKHGLNTAVLDESGKPTRGQMEGE